MGVAQAVGVVVAGGGLFLVVGVGVVGNVEVVLAVLRVESELIFGSLVADEGDKAAFGVSGVVVDPATGVARP